MKFRDLIEQEKLETMPEELIALSEAAFSTRNMEKIVKLYSKIMGKRMGGSFKSIGFEEYKRNWGPGKGFRVINNKGAQLRFNWDQKLAKQALYDLTSVDYWAPKNVDFQKPSRTVKFAPELNVVQILDKVTDSLLTGSINEANAIFDEFNILHEGRSNEDRAEFVKQMGLPKTAGRSDKYLKDYGKLKGVSEQVEVFLGAKESNSFEGNLKKVEKQFDKEIYANPETVFDDIEELLGLVAAGKWRTLIVCGQGGIGKTYHITEGPRSLPKLLGPEGHKWTYHSGTKASPLSFFKTLFEERKQVIVFDEADAILKHSEIVMMLKPILDTSGKNMAEYGIGTFNMVGKTDEEIEKYSDGVAEALLNGATLVRNKTRRLFNPLTDTLGNDEDSSTASAKHYRDVDVMLPSKFQFKGGMIFISNMKSEQIEKAIMSRSIFIDVYLAEQDVLKRIQSIGYAIAKGSDTVTNEAVDEVLESLGEVSGGTDHEITYMTAEYARKSKQVTVRALQLGLILRESGLDRWKELVALYA